MRANTIRSFALLAATAATVAAESTVSLLLPNVEGENIQAKVVGSSNSATTYILNCAPGTADEDCGIPSGWTIIQGPSTWNQAGSFADSYYSYGCKLGGTTSLSCDILATDATTTTTDSAVITESVAEMFRPVVVTGTETASVSATTGASPTAATATATETTGSEKTKSTSGSSSSATESSATASHSSSGNAAMPQVTGQAPWVIGGAAVAMAMALV